MTTDSSTVFDIDHLDINPISRFLVWLQEAERRQLPHANAMALATADTHGQPAARIVLLRGLDQRGFVFYTNYQSRKGLTLDQNPKASLVFFWPQLNRQVRVEGAVAKVSPSESDDYFAGRPRGHQLSAHASRQSQVIENRATLERQQERIERQYQGKPVPRPPHWGGYRVVPTMIEFWQEGEHRLHDRLRYTRQNPDASWTIDRLAP